VEGKYYSERQAAITLNINLMTLRKHRAAGKISCTSVCGVLVYTNAALREWEARYGPGVRLRQARQPAFVNKQER
jgi:hypothetical protein